MEQLFVDAAQLADQFEDLHDAAAGHMDRELLDVLAKLTADLRVLRDGLHDAALDPTDELAAPRLSR